jgi:sucrose phosphorylase
MALYTEYNRLHTQPAIPIPVDLAQMTPQTQLICYVDRLSGGGLAQLGELLDGPLAGLFGGVHLLPFFDPIDGADAGFDPIDHTKVDPRLGTWSNLAALSQRFEVMADLIVNHISGQSPQFLDFIQRGDASAWSDLILKPSAVFPGGATQAELDLIYRPRPGRPFSEVTLADGESRTVWTTFTPNQIDIDVESAQGQAYLSSILDRFQRSGVRSIRLDAAGYAIKRRGTSCFMLPETFSFIRELAGAARTRGMEVLVEIHAHYETQLGIAAQVDWVYDFALPPLILHAFCYGTAVPLRHWIRKRPSNSITVLDTHDGIGIVDIGSSHGRPGLVPPEELDRLVDYIHESSGGQSRLATGASASNLDLYQVNCTYFDACARDAEAYLAARAIQLFLPGVPQIYYVGLLGGMNDLDLLARTGVGRDINRHHYSGEEVLQAVRNPMVSRLFELIRLRNEHPALRGVFTVREAPSHVLCLQWSSERHKLELDVDLRRRRFEVRATAPSA